MDAGIDFGELTHPGALRMQRYLGEDSAGQRSVRFGVYVDAAQFRGARKGCGPISGAVDHATHNPGGPAGPSADGTMGVADTTIRAIARRARSDEQR